MLKETLTYKDFDGNKHTEEFHFHLRESDIAEITMVYPEGLPGLMRELNASKDRKRIIEIFKYIIEKSIGIRHSSKRFEKSEDIIADFMYSNAYSDMFMKLASDAEYAAKFMAGILPDDLQEKYKNDVETNEATQKLVELQNSKPTDVIETEVVSTPELSKLDQAVLKTYPDRLQDFTEKELFEMTDDEFRRLNGADPKKWPQKILVIAAQRKTAA